MASKEIVVHLTCSIKIFFVRKRGEKTSHCVKCITRIRRTLQKCDVIRLLKVQFIGISVYVHAFGQNINNKKGHIGPR